MVAAPEAPVEWRGHGVGPWTFYTPPLSSPPASTWLAEETSTTIKSSPWLLPTLVVSWCPWLPVPCWPPASSVASDDLTFLLVRLHLKWRWLKPCLHLDKFPRKWTKQRESKLARVTTTIFFINKRKGPSVLFFFRGTCYNHAICRFFSHTFGLWSLKKTICGICIIFAKLSNLQFLAQSVDPQQALQKKVATFHQQKHTVPYQVRPDMFFIWWVHIWAFFFHMLYVQETQYV